MILQALMEGGFRETEPEEKEEDKKDDNSDKESDEREDGDKPDRPIGIPPALRGKKPLSIEIDDEDDDEKKEEEDEDPATQKV